MTYLLDTNVVSELRKAPGVVNPRVFSWAQRPASELFISVVTVMEIEIGVSRIERRDLRQGAILRDWLDGGVLGGFANRIMPISLDIARRAALLHVPDPRPERDAYLAATASVHGLIMVTRNLSDFRAAGIPVIDPWAEAP